MHFSWGREALQTSLLSKHTIIKMFDEQQMLCPGSCHTGSVPVTTNIWRVADLPLKQAYFDSILLHIATFWLISNCY